MNNLAQHAYVSRDATQAKLDLRAAQAGRHRASQSYCTAERIEECAQRFAERPCLYFGEETYSYADLNAQVNQVAHAARAQGVRRGDVVAICLENRPGFLFAWLGLAKLGATVAFLNTNVAGKAMAHALGAAGAALVVVGEECLANFEGPELEGLARYWLWQDPENPDLARRALCEFDLGAAAASAPRGNPPFEWRAGLVAQDPAVYIFTSGTTGLPKAAVISHARWLITADVMEVTMEVSGEDCFYCFLPLYHGAASLSAAATAFAAGAALALRRKFSRRGFWNDVRRYRVTICQYVGEICRFLLTEPPQPGDRDHGLRKMIGAGLSVEVWQQFIDRFGPLQVFEGWGATESNTNTINVDNRLGSCGRIPYWEKTNLRIVRYDVDTDSYPRDANGACIVCQPGETGEALGRILDIPDVVAGRFEGYTSAEATAKKILRDVFEPGDAWWSSGDLLRYDEEGYCYFVDRIGDTYRWKSENVSTFEVADSLADAPGVDTIAIYGVQVPGHEGRAGMASIVMCEGHAFDPDAFFALTRARLPHYALPLFVRVSSNADMTSTFKLRKVRLQQEGYDSRLVTDPLYVRDEQAGTYVPLTPDSMARAFGTPLLTYPLAPPAADGSVVEVAPGILWARMPMPMSLDHVNVYLLRDGDGWWAVDTGLDSEPVRALWQQLCATQLDGLPLKAVLCTHFHSDHAGLAHWLSTTYDVPLYMTHGEFFMLRLSASPMPDPPPPAQQRFYARSGMPAETTASMLAAIGSHTYRNTAATSFRRLRAGTRLRIGDREWEVIIGEGHSPEHACLYSAADRLLIAGDQVLPTITSNVSVSSLEPEANPLQLWFDSLERLAPLAPDTLVLPSHHKVFRGLHPRLRQLREHHEQQFGVLRLRFADGQARTAYEVMQAMFPKLRGGADSMMALGEAMAHLAWLCAAGELVRTLDADGLYRFRAA
ncbi:long-chain-acyl-CoA synthetase [Massilia sp. GCM10023247]|uniref:long-chain-acyl-CoA synthetase n=1 Tax=Massilia sp. GCM10023247 TaxID=3252643 RepID=UPI00361F023E